MQAAEFHHIADAALAKLADALEDADHEGALDVELQPGMLTIALPGGKTFVVSKHAPSMQVWLSSPVSGGLHFSYMAGQWRLADGRELFSLVAAEVKQLSSVGAA